MVTLSKGSSSTSNVGFMKAWVRVILYSYVEIV